nr:D505 [uncultured bacterium]
MIVDVALDLLAARGKIAGKVKNPPLRSPDYPVASRIHLS